MNQSVCGCSQLPSWRGDKEEGADKTADMLVLRMKSLIRIKEDLSKNRVSLLGREAAFIDTALLYFSEHEHLYFA